MAYNPFNVFRRNQKGLFAVLTIFIMIMFTLSFGAGDFFTWLPTLIGKGKGQGEVVATIEGKKITDGDLARINTHRILASDFMTASIGVAAGKINDYIEKSLGNTSKDNKPIFIQFLGLRNGRLPYVDQQTMMLVQQSPELQRFIPMAMERNITQFRSMMSAMLATADTSKDDKEIARACENLIALDIRQIFNTGAGYFGHKAEGDDTLKGALDFDLWLKKAHQLGIDYSDDDAVQMYMAEFYEQMDGKSLAEMEQREFANKPAYNRDMIFSALADEFKVRTVQSVVLGRGNAPQVFPTPWNTYEFYRKECNGGTYSVVSVPAANFTNKVSGMPNESEMRKLFDQYRNKEADPAKDNLGLREPRKLKVGWLEVKGDEPFYKKLGADTLLASEAHAKAFLAGLAPLPRGSFGLIPAAMVFNLQDPALGGAYLTFKQKHGQDIDLAWFPNFTKDGLERSGPIDSSILKATNVAAAIAAAGGSLATGAGPLTMPLVFWEKARIEDRAARARALAALLAPVSDAGTGLLGSCLAAGGLLPAPLPLAVVRNDLLEKVKADMTRQAAERDLDHFQTELQKLGEKADKKEAKEYLAKFATERSLKVGESQAMHDQWTMAQDPGLKPLVDLANRGHSLRDAPLQFGLSFFYETDFRTRRPVSATSLYDPKPYPDTSGFGISLKDGEPSFLAWRTDEQAAESPKDFEKTKAKVVDLWKRIESRKLAEAAAGKFANDVRETLSKEPGGEQTSVIQRVFSDLHVKFLDQFPTLEEKLRSEYFNLEDVSPISSPEALIPTAQPAQPRPFQLTPRREMPYPTAQMQQELLVNKDKKLSTTLVLHDDSKDRFYVAVLKYRQDRRADEFYKDVYSGLGTLSNEIRNMQQQELRNDAFRDATALLKSEFKVEILNDKLK